MTIAALAIALFIIGYVAITFEHRWHLHKAVTATALGAGMWLLVALGGGENIGHATEILGAEIFGLIIFLLAAMSLVEILVHYRFFDYARTRLLKLGLDDRGQLWIIAGSAFLLSSIIDNLTSTIVAVQIARRFFKGRNLLSASAAIVIAANAGGAFSPIGDVTTIMLWLAGKFTALQIIGWAFLPSLILFLVGTWLISRTLERSTPDATDETVVLSRSEKVVAAAAFLSFPLPVLVHSVGLEPYFGLLMGLGIVGLLIAALRLRHPTNETHLGADIEGLLRKVDLASLLFFAGILLAVGALRHLGVLSSISESLFGSAPGTLRLVLGSSVLGVLSSLVDNIPLTAAAIDILKTTDPAMWALLAIAVGTGGSLTVIGSAAGVVAMGMVKDLTFRKYAEIALLPAAASYVVAILVWSAQYALVRLS